MLLVMGAALAQWSRPSPVPAADPVVVPAPAPPARIELPVAAPVEAPPEAVVEAPVVPKATEKASKPKGPSSIVTASAFARWLKSHPDWAPDAARASGRADAAYLSGWDGLSPPPDKAGGAVTNVPWAAAAAYCAGRGGLPGVDDGAQTWTESATQPWHEYRTSDGQPAWRRSDGATSTAVKRGESGAFIGFRCAR